jgi:hypothetical protein
MSSLNLAFFGPLAEHRFAVAQRLLDEDLEMLPVPEEKGMFIIRNGSPEFAKRRQGRELLLPFEHAGKFFVVALT